MCLWLIHNPERRYRDFINELQSRHEGATPHGGVASEAFFYKDGVPCEKAEATEINVVEYDSKGNRIFETYMRKQG